MSQIPISPVSSEVSSAVEEVVTTTTTTTTTDAAGAAEASPAGSASVRHEPVAVQLQGAQRRIERLLSHAAGDVPGLSRALFERIRQEVPRPRLFAAGWRKHADMTEAALRCDRAAAALARVPMKALMAHPVSEEHMQALREYTEAQHALHGAVRVFAGKTGETPFLSALMKSTQFRVAEALNLAASLQLAGRTGAFSPEETALRAGMGAKVADTGAEAGMLEGMRAVSPSMHGHILLDELAGKAQAVFAALDTLERDTSMTAEAFRAAARDVRDQVRDLRNRVDTLGMNRGALEGEAELREALKHLLNRSEERLNALHQVDLRRDVSRAVSDLMPAVPAEVMDFLSRMRSPGIASMMRSLCRELRHYDSAVAQLRQQAEAGRLSASQLHDGFHAAVQGLRGGEAVQGMKLLHVMRAVAEDKNNSCTVEIFCNAFRQLTGAQLAPQDAEPLLKMAQSRGFQEGPFAAVTDVVLGTPNIPDWLLEVQIEEISSMQRVVEGNTPCLRGDYVTAAVEGHGDVPTVVEASLRGIPADQLEWRAGDGIRTGSRVLVQGAASTVMLCTYRGDGGDEVNLVFKPEKGAKQGMIYFPLLNLGYAGETRFMQLNVAAFRSAEAIGCGDVVARSAIGMSDGRMGLFMEQAPGCTANDIRSGKACAFTADGRTMGLAEAFARLEGRGLRLRAEGNLMRGLNRLEWADILSGQADRHRGNYLVSVNADNGEVKVTGIDNDGSFGSRKVGATRLDITGDVELQQALVDRNAPFPDMYVEFSALSSEQRDEVALQLGAPILSGETVNVAELPEVRVALQQAGVKLPSLSVRVDALTAEQRSALERELGRPVEENSVVDISGLPNLQRMLLNAGRGLPDVLVRPGRLSEEQQRAMAMAYGRSLPDMRRGSLNVARRPELQQRLRQLGVELPALVIDTASYNEDQLRVLLSRFGLKQLFRPSFIDRQTYVALQGLDEEAYRRSLSSCMSRNAVEAAVQRLRDAKSLASRLAADHRVVDNWEDAHLVARMAQEKVRGGVATVQLRNGFYQRDFCMD